MSYKLLNDAAVRYPTLADGETEIWYMRPDFFEHGIMGSGWLKHKGLSPDPANLNKTHIHLGSVHETDPSRIYSLMQGEFWSPNGEANELIRSKGLHHTSMSVGDIMVIDGRYYLVDNVGIVGLPL